MLDPIIFSTTEEAGGAVTSAGREARLEIYRRLDQIEVDEPLISTKVARFVGLLSEARPDIRFGIASEDNDPDRWVLSIFLPEEDRSAFLDIFHQTLAEFSGDGLEFNVRGRGDYPAEVLQAETTTS